MKVLRNQLVLPLNFEILIDENDPVWKLTEICDTLDYTRLYDEYLRHWRVIDPVVLFEILVFAYMNGIYSSRAIEHACKTDIRFMWLLQGQSSLARFSSETSSSTARKSRRTLTVTHLSGQSLWKRICRSSTLKSTANCLSFAGNTDCPKQPH